MTWVGILQAILGIAQQLASYLHDKQLMDAGAAKSALEGIQNAQAAIARAKAARDAVSDDPASVQRDPDNTDNDKPSVH